jgi:hypothetical protein
MNIIQTIAHLSEQHAHSHINHINSKVRFDRKTTVNYNGKNEIFTQF